MGDKEIWAALGIAPTNDQGAIRVAYAARLKSIDPDADPAAFISLREAYVLARGDAPSRAETPPPPPPQQLGAVDFHGRIAALADLFSAARNGEHPWLSREAKADMRRIWGDLAAELGTAGIADYGAAELAIADLIASRGRLTVGLVMPATEFFGWATREIDISTDEAIFEVVRRYRMIRFLQAVRKPGIAHHAAWVELTTKAYPGSSRGRCDPWLVFQLLVIIREIWPEMETELDPLRVELWRDNTADPMHPESLFAQKEHSRRTRAIIYAVLALFAIQFVARMVSTLSQSH